MSEAKRQGWEATRQEVLAAVHAMDREGLTEGTAGNVSGRTPDGCVVLTPAAMSYPNMRAEDLVVTDLEGKVLDGARLPTSEQDLHLACLRKYPEIGAVVHTHAVHASMFAVAGHAIPCVLEEFEYYVGGDVAVAPYHRTGTKALGESAAAHVRDRAAVLLANHGLVVVGASPSEALQLTRLVERAAMIISGATRLGTPPTLPDAIRSEFKASYLERRTAATAR